MGGAEQEPGKGAAVRQAGPWRVRPSRLAIAAAIALWVSGCNSPTDPGHGGYEGQWNGTTAQGKAISFTISPDERVTVIAIAHEFNGCSGSQTFSGLNIDIAPQVQCIPGPCPSAVTAYRAFGYTSADRLEGPSTDIQGLDTRPGIV